MRRTFTEVMLAGRVRGCIASAGFAALAAVILSSQPAAAQPTLTPHTERYTYDSAGRLSSVTYDDAVQIRYAFDANGNLSSVVTGAPIGVAAEEEADLPGQFALHAAYPNPFNPQTTIGYDVREFTRVRLEIFDLLGRTVTRLVDADLEPGRYEAIFDASDLASGAYLYRIQMGSFQKTRTLILIK